MTDTTHEDEYIFTFGIDSQHVGKFVAIVAREYYDARAIMVRHFGDKWAFQYPNRGMAGVDRFNLTELKLPEGEDKLPRREMVKGAQRR